MLFPANKALFSSRGGDARYLRSALIYDPCRRIEHLHLYFHEFRPLLVVYYLSDRLMCPVLNISQEHLSGDTCATTYHSTVS